MTSERIPRVTYSRRPYAFALVGVGLIVLAAWMNRGRLRPVGAGTVAPQFEVIDLGGNPARLSDYEGEVVMINIWATWCAPCREEMPTLDSLQAQLGGEQFEVVALSVDHVGISVVEKFYRETSIQHLRQYIDPSTLATSTLGIEGVPTTLLLDHDGREIGRLVGAAEWDSPAMVDLMTRTIEGVPD